MSSFQTPFQLLVFYAKEVLASGEANFADLDEQRTDLRDGINLDFQKPDPDLLPLAEPTPNSGTREITDFPIAPNRPAPLTTTDITVFRPYIHYYPSTVAANTSRYTASFVDQELTVDYSLVLQPAQYVNAYTTQQVFPIDD